MNRSIDAPGEDEALETLSMILARIERDDGEAPLRLGELVGSLGQRGYGLLFFLCAAPNLTPGPSMPGFSTLFGVPLVIAAAQLFAGRPQPWLPRRIAEFAIPRARLRGILKRMIPMVVMLEKVLRPRLRGLVDGGGRRWVGACLVVFGTVLALPIPVFSMLPAAAILVIGLGLLGHDGLAVALGIVAGVVSLGVLEVVAWTALRALGWI